MEKCNRLLTIIFNVRYYGTLKMASLQGFAEPLHRAESVKRKALHITHIVIHTMYIDKHATLDTLHFQPDAKILQNPVVISCPFPKKEQSGLVIFHKLYPLIQYIIVVLSAP